MTINCLDYQHQAPVTGEFRVRRLVQKIAPQGKQYLAFVIEDCTGELDAIAWNDSIANSNNLAEFDCITLKGQIRAINGNWLVNVTSAELLQDEPEHPVNLIPRSIAPLPSSLEELKDLADCISHPALRRFISWVLTDADIVFPFVTLPASRQHHHSSAGGLLEHSLECASMVSRYIEFPEYELELAIVAALFHDIGKTRTLECVGKHTPSGYLLGHEALTLEVLAPHLHRLDSICPDVSMALRYLWTWRYNRFSQRHPLLTVAEAITASDHISSGLNRQKSAFAEHPHWHTFARTRDNCTFWRPRLGRIKKAA